MTDRSFNLVVPLVQGELPFSTAMRTTETTAQAERSGAVSQLNLFRPGDVDSTTGNSTPATTTMPGARTSETATRTTTTRTTSTGSCWSADETSAPPAAFLFTELVQAYFDCRQAKRNKASALAFELNLETNLLQLDEELRAGTYQPGPSICFAITRPKPREVWAAAFRDRIVHHLLYNHVGATIEARFIADSCACIPGRGTLYGARRLEAKIRSLTQNWKRTAYYLKLDITNFFVSIDKRTLSSLLGKHIAEPWWLALARQILLHDPRRCCEVRGRTEQLQRVPKHKRLTEQPAHLGLPIGNLSSQFFANIYLNTLDQHIKHIIGARHYVRYVDDMVLLHEDPNWLTRAHANISAWLPAHLGIHLNDSKTILQPIDRGVDFVGQVIKPWRRTLRRRTLNDALSRTATTPADELLETANSYFGLLRQASHSHRDRTRLANLLRRQGHCVAGDLTKTFPAHHWSNHERIK